MNQFSGARKKLMKSILTPITAMLFLVFIVIYATITAIGSANYQASVTNAIERKVNSFGLTLSLQVSSNSTITNSNDVIAYAQGNSEHESSVRSLLSQKLSQSPNLLGNQIYFVNDLVDPISAYSVSGLPSSNEVLSLQVIDHFITSSNNYTFAIRHEFIPNTYNFTQYPKTYGIATLFEKIYDSDKAFVALLASDYSSQKLYTDVLDFTYHASFTEAKTQLQTQLGFLKLTNSDAQIEGQFKQGTNKQGLLTNIYNYNLSDDVSLVVSLSLVKPFLDNVLFFIVFLAVILILNLFTYYLVRSSVRRIIDPLEKINQNIKDTLE